MGTTYETAGAKAGNGEGDEYEEETEDLIETTVENADEASMKADDEETLLDDSENLPMVTAAPSDPAVKSLPIGVHSTLGDPDPEVMGADPINVEGEETNTDADDDEEMLLDSDADDDELDE